MGYTEDKSINQAVKLVSIKLLHSVCTAKYKIRRSTSILSLSYLHSPHKALNSKFVPCHFNKIYQMMMMIAFSSLAVARTWGGRFSNSFPACSFLFSGYQLAHDSSTFSFLFFSFFFGHDQSKVAQQAKIPVGKCSIISCV